MIFLQSIRNMWVRCGSEHNVVLKGHCYMHICIFLFVFVYIIEYVCVFLVRWCDDWPLRPNGVWQKMGIDFVLESHIRICFCISMCICIRICICIRKVRWLEANNLAGWTGCGIKRASTATGSLCHEVFTIYFNDASYNFLLRFVTPPFETIICQGVQFVLQSGSIYYSTLVWF